MKDKNSYSLLTDKRVKNILTSSYDAAPSFGLRIVELKKKYRTPPQEYAFIDLKGNIVEQFSAIVPKALNNNEHLKKVVLPITYDKEKTKEYYRNPTPEADSGCHYIDKIGNILGKDNEKERILIKNLIESKLEDLPGLIEKITIQDPNKEYRKFDTYYNIIEAREKEINATKEDVKKIEDAWFDLMKNKDPFKQARKNAEEQRGL